MRWYGYFVTRVYFRKYHARKTETCRLQALQLCVWLLAPYLADAGKTRWFVCVFMPLKSRNRRMNRSISHQQIKRVRQAFVGIVE